MLKFIPCWEFPLLARELTESSGRSRTYVIRTCYAALVVLAGVIFWGVLSHDSSTGWINRLDIGPLVGHWTYYVQMVALDWLWPIIACSALTIEKERNTLSTLLLTRLSPPAIILEKFLSRLWLATSLLLTCLPLLAFCFSQGNASLVYFVKFPGLLLLAAIEATAISMMCSAYSRSTAGALIGTYICFSLAKILTGVLGLAIVVQRLGITFTGNRLMYAVLSSLHLVPPSRYRLYGSGLIPLHDMNVRFVSDFSNPVFWTITVPVYLGFYLPPMLIALLALCLASRFLRRRSQPARQGTSIKEFVDRVGAWARRINDNPITRGRVVFKEGRRLPDDDPVAWRESTTRALGQPRYLIGNLLVLEVPIIWFLLIASSRLSGSQLHEIVANMQTFLWTGMLLMVCVVVTGVIIQERQSQTLELLLTTPLSRRAIVFQKRAGIERMLWIMQAPLWTCLAFRAFFGSPWQYLFNEAGMLLLYPRIVAWLAVDSSLRHKTRLAAIMDVLFSLTAWIAVGTMIGIAWCVCLIVAASDVFYPGSSPPSDPMWFVLVTPWQLSPATLLYLNLLPQEPNYATASLLPGIVNLMITLTALRWLRNRCLGHADRFLRK